jgi:hypothetical protein
MTTEWKGKHKGCVSVSCWLTPEIRKKLREYSLKNKIFMSNVISKAITSYINKYE